MTVTVLVVTEGIVRGIPVVVLGFDVNFICVDLNMVISFVVVDRAVVKDDKGDDDIFILVHFVTAVVGAVVVLEGSAIDVTKTNFKNLHYLHHQARALNHHCILQSQ